MKLHFKYAKVILSAFVGLSASKLADAGHTHFPNSEWTLNLAKSDLGPGSGITSDVVTLSIDTDAWIAYSEVSVGTNGKISRLSWAGPQNGELRPMKGMKGALASFSTEDDSGHFIYPNGSSFCNWFYASPDGKTLTYHVVGMKTDHTEVRQQLIYDRTK